MMAVFVTTDAATPVLECSEACGGNGFIDCWDCGGSGMVTIPDDDITDVDVECSTCGGNGGWRCPACKEREGE